MVIRRLLSQAYLFDDPGAYEAGVRDTLDLLAAGGAGAEPADATPMLAVREHAVV